MKRYYFTQFVQWWKFSRYLPWFYYDHVTKRHFLMAYGLDTCGFTCYDAYRRFRKEHPTKRLPPIEEIEVLSNLNKKVTYFIQGV